MSIPHTFILIIKELPKPVKITFGMYLSGIFVYNISATYLDSVEYLNKFRNNKLLPSELKIISDDWSAVKYGASQFFCERLWFSIVFPVSGIKNFIPWIVLKMNPPKK